MMKAARWLAVLVLASCGKNGGSDTPPTSQQQPGDASERIVVGGFATPESVLYDAVGDVYLVSNINGTPAQVDDNGFISRLAPDGKVLELRWIDGAKDDVTLNAPKGSAIVGDTLYVADITTVRMFDRATGAAKGEIAIPGATFLNDVVAGPGGVYVSDSGLTAEFKPSGTDAIYRIDAAGAPTPVIADPNLGHPNGLALATDGSLWVVTFGSGEIFQVSTEGKKQNVEQLATGQLDGVVADGDDLWVSSWQGKVVYRGRPGSWSPLLTDLQAPADIGFDIKRRLILIPLFENNKVVITPGPVAKEPLSSARERSPGR